jgi:hypothetical protein
VLEAADHHALTPLLHRALLAGGASGALPPFAREAVAERAAGVAARNLLFASELADILTLAAQRSLAVAPLRGLALGERLHGDPSLRPMGDLDLLVRRHELDAMTALLRDRGYEEIDRRPGFARAFSYTLEFAKQRHGWIIVEPHRRSGSASRWIACGDGATVPPWPAWRRGDWRRLTFSCICVSTPRTRARRRRCSGSTRSIASCVAKAPPSTG